MLLHIEFYFITLLADNKNITFMAAMQLNKKDSTLMTKEEFYAKLERGEKAYERGECHEMLPEEDLTTYLRRRFYKI